MCGPRDWPLSGFLPHSLPWILAASLSLGCIGSLCCDAVPLGVLLWHSFKTVALSQCDNVSKYPLKDSGFHAEGVQCRLGMGRFKFKPLNWTFYFYLFREGKGGRKGEKHPCVRATLIVPPPGDLARKQACAPPGNRTSWGPFSSQAGAQPTQPHQRGCIS